MNLLQIMIKSNKLLTFVIIVIIATITDCKYLELKRLKKEKLQTSTLGNSQCTPVGSNNQSNLGIGNCQDNIYYITLEVGTPSQAIGVQFDTGSNILWIPTVSGTGSGFNTAASSTYSPTSQKGSLSYADGSSVSGFYGTDFVKLTNTPINVNAQILWVNKEVQMNYPPQIQGLVGMGFTTTPNFLDIAYSNNLISSPVFALALTDPINQSIIYYNEIPPEIVNETFFVPVVGNVYWQVQIIGLTVGNIDMTSISATIAIIDSGTSYFYLNSNLFNSIITNFFSMCNNNVNTPICPCGSNYPTFSFMFQGIEVQIDQSSYMQTISSSKQCTYLFGVLDTVPNILLGDIFFRNYVITFDKLNQQIGFSGKINFLQNIQLGGGDIAGYALLGIAGLLFVMSTVAFCALGKFVAQKQPLLNFKNKGLQLIKTSYSPSYNTPGLKVRLNSGN